MIEEAQDGKKMIAKNTVADQDQTPYDRGYETEMKERAIEVELCASMFDSHGLLVKRVAESSKNGSKRLARAWWHGQQRAKQSIVLPSPDFSDDDFF